MAKKSVTPAQSADAPTGAEPSQSPAPAGDTTPPDAENTSPVVPVFDPAGSVAPADPTPGSEPPAPPEVAPEKRGRGRPKGSGKGAGLGAKKSRPDDLEALAVIANAELVVGALDLLRAGISGGECTDNPKMRELTVGAWSEFLAESGINLPPWVKASVMSIAYVAPAMATPKAQSRLSATWAKIKGWYVARRG